MKVKIEDLKKELYIGELGEYFIYYDRGYIGDIIAEIADNNISLYNCDLLDWAKGNSSYIDDAVKEFGINEKNFDFFRLIQNGQYLAVTQELYENLEDSLKFYMYDYIEKNTELLALDEDTVEELENCFDFNDNNEELENLIDKINEILKIEE